MTTTAHDVATRFETWRSRYIDRDYRHSVMNAVLAGDLSVLDPDEEEVENRSPNMIQVALEDTAEAAALVPTVRVQPSGTNKEQKKNARAMEQIAMATLQANNIDLEIIRSVMDLGAFGLSAWTVTPDFEERRAVIERRDPTQCYPEPGFRPGHTVKACVFGREIRWSQLPVEYEMKILEYGQAEQVSFEESYKQNLTVKIIEYYDDVEVVIVAVAQGSQAGEYHRPEAIECPVELDRFEHGIGVCPVVVEGRITFDGDFRGQFDQVTGLLGAHVRLMGMLLDYADQAVYSDVWVRDLIGEMPYGGGAYIELGPQGAIGRVPPAVSALNVGQDLQALIDGIHVGGRWPKSRPGEISQSIASAKFLETSAGIMNTAIRTYHLILQRQIEKTLRIAFHIEKEKFGGENSVARGVLRNQEFLMDYDPGKTIDLDARVSVEYGLGLGRDPANSAVLHIQYSKEGYISQQFVRENIDGLKDVGREEIRLDEEKFRDMALAKLMQGLEQGMVPDAALVEIAKARRDGMDLFDIYQKYIVEPQAAAQEQQIPTGLGGPPLMPGMMPGGGPPGLGGPPGPGGPPGGPPGGKVPPAPGGAELLARMNVPAGPGGTLGTQVQG